MGDVDHNHPYEFIGKRANSTFRVPGDYFASKPRFPAGIDPSTGGPCVVVYKGTDDEVPGATIDQGGRIIFPARSEN